MKTEGVDVNVNLPALVAAGVTLNSVQAHMCVTFVLVDSSYCDKHCLFDFGLRNFEDPHQDDGVALLN